MDTEDTLNLNLSFEIKVKPVELAIVTFWTMVLRSIFNTSFILSS